MHDSIHFWVGYPADPSIGVIDCGRLAPHPDTPKSLLRNDMDRGDQRVADMAFSLTDLETKYGQFTTMLPVAIGVNTGTVGFITARGYRVVLIPSRDVDRTVSQEALGEWVEGVG